MNWLVKQYKYRYLNHLGYTKLILLFSIFYIFYIYPMDRDNLATAKFTSTRKRTGTELFLGCF